MTVEEKLIKIAENEQKVYEAWQKSMVDGSKTIKKTAVGTTTLRLNDVSEIPHDIEVQLGEYVKYENPTWQEPSLFDGWWDTTYPGAKITHVADNFKMKDGETYLFRFKADESEKPVYIRWLRGDDFAVLFASMTYNNGYYEYTYSNTVFMMDVTMGDIDGGSCEFGYACEDDITITEIQITQPTSDFSGISLSVNGDTYTSPSNGLIQGIKSYSPNMTFTADEGVVFSVKYNKSWGTQMEYDRFWDTYQDNGNRTHYLFAFAGYGWTDETFKPKYDIKPRYLNGQYIFRYSKITDLVKILEDCNVKLDLSDVTSGYYMFSNGLFTRLPILDFSNTAGDSLQHLFSYCSNLKSVEKLILPTTIPTSNNFFYYSFTNCTALEDIVIEGYIAKDFDIHWSTKLTKKSFDSIFTALYKETGGTLTVSRTAVINAFGSTENNEWLSYVSWKPNWTIILI